MRATIKKTVILDGLTTLV